MGKLGKFRLKKNPSARYVFFQEWEDSEVQDGLVCTDIVIDLREEGDVEDEDPMILDNEIAVADRVKERIQQRLSLRMGSGFLH